MPSHDDKVPREIYEILEELRHLRRETKELKHIMATYSEALKSFIAQQTTFNESISAGIDATSTSLEGLSGDLKNLNDQIAALQNSSGQVTPEDQALIDAARPWPRTPDQARRLRRRYRGPQRPHAPGGSARWLIFGLLPMPALWE